MRSSWVSIGLGFGLCAQLLLAQIAPRPLDAATDASSGSQSFHSPVVGLVSSTNRVEVRAILGVPGAALLSAPLPVPADVTRLYFAPGQQYALAERGGSSKPQYASRSRAASLRTASLPLAVVTFTGAQLGALNPVIGIAEPDIVSFSPSGGAAVLYSTSEAQLEVLTGLPSSPQISLQIARSSLPDDPQFLAIADDGVTLLEGSVHNAVYLIGSSTQPSLIFSATTLAAMIFAPASSTAAVFDSATGSVSLLQNVSGSPSTRLLTSGLSNLGPAAMVQFDSSAVLVTGSGSNTLWRIDSNTSQSQQVQLPALPASIAPLQLPHRFLLSWSSGQPAWMLDTSGPAQAVYFIAPGGGQAQ